MNSSNFGKLVLSGVSLGSIAAMSFFIYNDKKRLNEEYLLNEDIGDIVISKPPIRTTYVSPHRRSYDTSYMPSINETIMPASRENNNVQNCFIISNLEDTFFSLESYREHLEMVYGLETYYGDDTLQSLLEHSRELSDFLKESQQVFSLNQKEFLEYVESKNDTGQEETQEIEE